MHGNKTMFAKPVTAGCVAALALAGAAQAQIFLDPKFEASAAYSRVSDSDGDAVIGALTLRGGVDFSSFLGFEAEGSIGVFDDDDEDVELDSALGAFAKGTFLVTPNIDVHGRAGLGRVELTAAGEGQDETGVALGLGGELFPAGRTTAFRIDYTRYFLDEDDVDFLTLGLHYRF